MWMLLLGLGIGLVIAAAAAGVAGWSTARRVAVREMRQRANERLSEMKAMTGGLAHEIKNPLSSINLNIQLLQEDLADLKRLIRNLGEHGAEPAERMERLSRRMTSLAREIEHLRDILEDFLRFAGRIKLHREWTDIHELISQLVDFFAPQAQVAKLHLRAQLPAGPVTALVDAALLKQALLNLMINATKATEQARRSNQPHGGGDELIIRCERRRAAATVGGSGGGGSSEDELHIHVIDTGPGMSPEVKAKIFEPYYSTTRGGTGLGLPVTRRIVEEHGGRIEVFTEPGRGSDFTVILPVGDGDDGPRGG